MPKVMPPLQSGQPYGVRYVHKPEAYNAGFSHQISSYSDAIRIPAGRGHDQIVASVRQYLTRPEDIKTYVDVRKEMITHEPTFMLSVVSALVWPSIHIELEVVALVPAKD